MQEALLDDCVGEIPGSGQGHRGCENSLEEPGLQYTTVLHRIKVRPYIKKYNNMKPLPQFCSRMAEIAVSFDQSASCPFGWYK